METFNFNVTILLDHDYNFFASMDKITFAGEKHFCLMDLDGDHHFIKQHQVTGFYIIESCKADDANTIQVLLRDLTYRAVFTGRMCKRSRTVMKAREILLRFNRTTRIIKSNNHVKL